jgi:beta-glucanase (GH16 family)
LTFGTPNRRDILIGAAALAAWRPTLGWAAEPPALLTLDFTQGPPAGVTFERPGPAMADGPGGALTLAAAHAPRLALDPATGRPQGLLIEGAATNFARNSMALSSHTWQFKGAATSGLSQDVTSPDGTHSATRLRIRQQKGDLGVVGGGGPVGAGEIFTLSIYLRQVGDEAAEWALNLFDYGTYHGHFERVQLSPRWQRVSFGIHWEARDISNKVMNIAAGRPEWAADSMHEAFAWGCQLEAGRSSSSLIATDTLPVARPADVVTIDAAALSRPTGLLRVSLPRGGVRAGTILDTEGGGIRLGYSDSGWLEATVGGLTVSGSSDVTGDTMVELGWGPAGVTLKSGEGTVSVLRGAVAGKTGPIACGATARLFARIDGSAPLNAVLGHLALEPGAGVQKIAATVAAPSFVPAGYRLAFGDEFDDGDLARINENATGGKPGAPAWRSRYHQDRFTVVNQEKQIYMDPAFAGKAGHPLGVQPFSIKNGILTITAARADPTNVSPHILNFKYTSGCITSELTHWQTYGYFEMRARLPVGKGFWPAFWLLPKAAKWPPEIDIFEGAGTRPGAVHLGVLIAKGQVADKWIEDVINVGDGFHVYGLEWTREQLTWFLDGKPVWRQANAINEDMYILANLALGSRDPKFIPDPDDTTPFPGRFEIDYIRAYRKA